MVKFAPNVERSPGHRSVLRSGVGYLGVAFVTLMTLVVVNNAGAATLVMSNIYPDIYTNGLSVNYVASTHTLTASGSITPASGLAWKFYASLADRNASIFTTYNTGTFSLSAVLAVSGTGASTVLTPTSGSLSVWAGNGGASSAFFTSSTLFRMGYNVGADGTGSDTWQFLFGSGGGQYGGIAYNGVVLHGGGTTYTSGASLGKVYNSSTVDFSSSFGNTPGLGSADTFVTPLPSTAQMLLLLLACLPMFRRKPCEL